jgi:SAM-dependent methyltransferase
LTGSKKHFEANLKRWNELVGIHAKSREYDLEGFKAGRSSLHYIELEALGDVSGRSLLHLQCHFGLDTLSWARLGARVTGVDFSEKAIELARALSRELGIPAEFVCSNVYDLPRVLGGTYDIVFTSYGVLCWLDDLRRWGEIVASYLKEGGTFFIADFHPFSWVFDDEEKEELKIRYGYFASEPERFEGEGTYADLEAVVENVVTYEWQHTFSDILNALAEAGLRMEEVKEYPYSVYKQLPMMEEYGDGYYRFASDDHDIPLMYSIKARK